MAERKIERSRGSTSATCFVVSGNNETTIALRKQTSLGFLLVLGWVKVSFSTPY